MNPFTKYLRQWSSERDFNVFVEQWDRLERIVVDIYRAKMDIAAAEPVYAEVWPWLREHYPHWRDALRPYWQATRRPVSQLTMTPFNFCSTAPRQWPAAAIGGPCSTSPRRANPSTATSLTTPNAGCFPHVTSSD